MITQVLIEAKLVETFPSAIPGCPVHHPMRGNGSASAVSARLQRLGVYTAHGDKQFALDLDETTDAELASIGIGRSRLPRLKLTRRSGACYLKSFARNRQSM